MYTEPNSNGSCNLLKASSMGWTTVAEVDHQPFQGEQNWCYSTTIKAKEEAAKVAQIKIKAEEIARMAAEAEEIAALRKAEADAIAKKEA